MDGAERGGLPEGIAGEVMALEERLAPGPTPREPAAPRGAGEPGCTVPATSPPAS